MLAQNSSPKLQPLIDTILTLSPQEQLQLIMILSQSLLNIQDIPTSWQPQLPIQTPRHPNKVDDAIADFWPEDESVDEFLEFTRKERQANLLF